MRVTGWTSPDLDVLIRSENDPPIVFRVSSTVYSFINFYSSRRLSCRTSLYLLVGQKRGHSLNKTLIFSNLGYGTHALLDSLTTYGTVLLWPFSETRFAWNLISIIDPIFTVPILLALTLALFTRRGKYARAGLAWAFLYLSLAFFQQRAAVHMGEKLRNQEDMRPLILMRNPVSQTFSFGKLFMNLTNVIMLMLSGWAIVLPLIREFYKEV